MQLIFMEFSTALRWKHEVILIERTLGRLFLGTVASEVSLCWSVSLRQSVISWCGYTCHSQFGCPCLQCGNKCSPPDIFLTVSLLHHPWKEAVANNLLSAAFPTHGTDLGEHSVFLGLDILHCLLFLEAGEASLSVTALFWGGLAGVPALIFPWNVSALSSPFSIDCIHSIQTYALLIL